MPPHMRARHEVFGVKDVPKTAHYLDNGWTEVDPATPLTADERRKAENDERRGGVAPVEYAVGSYDPAQHSVEEVQTYLASAEDVERDRVLEAERAGKARKTLLNED